MVVNHQNIISFKDTLFLFFKSSTETQNHNINVYKQYMYKLVFLFLVFFLIPIGLFIDAESVYRKDIEQF